jgi:hypothetical protein
MRKLISIRIDPKIYQTARKMDLNISKTCENSLKQAIQRLSNANPETNCNSTCVSTSQKRGGAGNGIRTHAAQRGHRLSRPAHYPLCPRDVRQEVNHHPGILSRHY